MIYSFDGELALKIGFRESIVFSALEQISSCSNEMVSKLTINRVLKFLSATEISVALDNLEIFGLVEKHDNSYKVKSLENITIIKAKEIMSKIPTIEQVVEFAKERGRSDLATKFYNYYKATDWKDREGKTIKNWKLKFLYWEGRNPKQTTTREVL